MKNYLIVLSLFILSLTACVNDSRPVNVSAKDEQAHTELNQQNLNKVQPAPNITWSLEREII